MKIALMNRLKAGLFVLLIIVSSSSRAQEDNAFVFTLHGGLFFPSIDGFDRVYQSHSDLIWSFGAAVPIGSGVLIGGDIGFFRSSGFFDATLDSTARFEERIVHLGLQKKESIGRRTFLRLNVGFNRVKVKQATASPRSSERSVETDDNTGYFTGVGLEELLESQHLSFYADALYDYSRSHKREFSGDFGGFRFVIGLNIILF